MFSEGSERTDVIILSTDMAAIVKLGNCAGRRGVNALVRLKYLSIVERNISTRTARLLVGSQLGICGSYSPVFR